MTTSLWFDDWQSSLIIIILNSTLRTVLRSEDNSRKQEKSTVKISLEADHVFLARRQKFDVVTVLKCGITHMYVREAAVGSFCQCRTILNSFV